MPLEAPRDASIAQATKRYHREHEHEQGLSGQDPWSGQAGRVGEVHDCIPEQKRQRRRGHDRHHREQPAQRQPRGDAETKAGKDVGVHRQLADLVMV